MTVPDRMSASETVNCDRFAGRILPRLVKPMREHRQSGLNTLKTNSIISLV